MILNRTSLFFLVFIDSVFLVHFFVMLVTIQVSKSILKKSGFLFEHLRKNFVPWGRFLWSVFIVQRDRPHGKREMKLRKLIFGAAAQIKSQIFSKLILTLEL